MVKRLLFILGVIAGFLVSEIFRREKMERLQELEAKRAREKARFAQYDREWQEELKKMPFQERLDYELWEAGMRLNDWEDDVNIWDDDEDDEEEGV